ncbi:hypothetical protein ACH5RR_032800 [Cinchona calisaya]|uniref:GATA-type domain-containing protein n=1 Tax=Cinchona calisaya TaxID=153742 RepID=A0ABD2YJ58_9GENT
MDALHNPDVAEAGCFLWADEDDLLNFSLDDGEEDKENKNKNSSSFLKESPYSFFSSNTLISHQHDDISRSSSFPEFVEEELEWLSNKDTFPALETCFGLFSETLDLDGLNHQSPVSVVEHSSSGSNGNGGNSGNGSAGMSCGSLLMPASFPVRPRSQRRRRKRSSVFGDLPIQQWQWWNYVNIKNNRQDSVLPPLSTRTNAGASIGRKCLHCQADQTPQWRAGPMGPKTLCNACGVRYKSGRLVPEYRPACSPTFSSALHSNSHRKVVEMRRQKQLGM